MLGSFPRGNGKLQRLKSLRWLMGAPYHGHSNTVFVVVLFCFLFFVFCFYQRWVCCFCTYESHFVTLCLPCSKKDRKASKWACLGRLWAAFILSSCISALSTFLQRACTRVASFCQEQDSSHDLRPSDRGPLAQGAKHCHQGSPLFRWAFSHGRSLVVAVQESDWAGQCPNGTVRSSF